MRRRSLLVSAGATAALARPVRAQSIARPVRVGFLTSAQPTDPALSYLRVGFGRIGWVEGRDFVIKARFAELYDAGRFPALLEALLRDGVDVMVVTAVATRLVPTAEKSLPVVFSFSGDPVAAGYVKTLARPGGNATGNSQLMWELVGKRIELLREIAPQARRTLVVQSPDHPGEAEERSRSQRVGAELGLEMMIRPVRDRAELDRALADGAAAGCDSMLCFTDSVTVANRHLIADHARRTRVPAVFPRREFCEAGGLASYGPSIADLTARLAVFVQRIAGGARAGDIPVEWPTVIETIANRRTAESIGVQLPSLVLARADEVIE